MSFSTGLAVGIAAGSSHAVASGSAAAGLTVGQALVLGIGIPAAAVAGAYLGHKSMQNAKFRSTAKFVVGAALFSPFLAAEDLLRYAGADVPKEGVFYNHEGKSMLQIWEESAPV